MRRLLIVATLLMSCLSSVAQEGNLLQRAGALWERHYRGAEVDTSFVMRPSTRWTLKGRMQMSSYVLSTNGSYNGTHFSSSLGTDVSAKVSLSASYLGLTLSASVNPQRLFGDGHDYGISLNYYGRRFGAEFAASISQAPQGWVQMGEGDVTPLALNNLLQAHFRMNLYYIFNAKRFSYPAAFSQSYIQRRSSGSVIAGAAFEGMHLSLGDSTLGEPTYRFSYGKVGLGVGYGYNFVPSQGWLLHLSALPSLIINSQRIYEINGVEQPSDGNELEFAIVGRGAVVYSFPKVFLGMTHIFNFSNTKANEIAMKNVSSQMMLFVGIRL